MNVSAHRSRRPAAPKAGLPLTCGISLLIGAGTALLLLLIAACITYAQADPAQTALPAAMTVLYLSAALSGAAAARKADNAFLAAVICGGCILAVTALTALLTGESVTDMNLPASVFAHLAIPAASLAGAFLGKRRSKKSAARKRKHRRK